jgi:hypothetical protein
MKIYRVSGAFLILLALSTMGCDKYNLENNKEMILGTWVSLDKNDTLDIVDENRFYKTVGTMQNELFSYELFVDSIEIVYSGSLYILVYPTKHKYSLDKERLTIDCSNKNCYGFSNQEKTYTKE